MFVQNIPMQCNIVLDRGNCTSCTVNLQGATITSWRIHNQEMICINRHSHFTPWTCCSGGIQFVFPVSGPWVFWPNNGFARNMTWTVEQGPTRLASGDVYAVVSVRDDAYPHGMWNFPLKLYYKITLFENRITFNIGVHNPCLYNIMTPHGLMKVPGVCQCRLLGYKGSCCNCKAMNSMVYCDGNSIITVTQQTNRNYLECPHTMVVNNALNFFNPCNPWINPVTLHGIGSCPQNLQLF